MVYRAGGQLDKPCFSDHQPNVILICLNLIILVVKKLHVQFIALGNEV